MEVLTLIWLLALLVGFVRTKWVQRPGALVWSAMALSADLLLPAFASLAGGSVGATWLPFASGLISAGGIMLLLRAACPDDWGPSWWQAICRGGGPGSGDWRRQCQEPSTKKALGEIGEALGDAATEMKDEDSTGRSRS